MKKIIYCSFLILLLALFNINISAAQEQNVYAGIRAGINFASSTSFTSSTNIGFMGGIYMGIPFENLPVTFQPAVLYSIKGFEKGFNFSFSGSNYDFSNAVSISYIEIPLLFKFDIDVEGSFNPHFYAGPYVAVKVGASQTSTNDINNEKPPFGPGNFFAVDLDDIRTFDAGGVLAATLNANRFRFGLRYSFGFISYLESGSAKNTAYSIIVGYEF